MRKKHEWNKLKYRKNWIDRWKRKGRRFKSWFKLKILRIYFRKNILKKWSCRKYDKRLFWEWVRRKQKVDWVSKVIV